MARIFHHKAYARVASEVNGNLNLSYICSVEHIDWIPSLNDVVNVYLLLLGWYDCLLVCIHRCPR